MSQSTVFLLFSAGACLSVLALMYLAGVIFSLDFRIGVPTGDRGRWTKSAVLALVVTLSIAGLSHAGVVA